MPTFERSHTISLFRNPVTGKGQSADASGDVFFTGSEVGGEPSVLMSEYWMDETLGSRMVQGNWSSALYGATGVTDYPKIFALGSTRGIGSRNVTGGNEITGFRKQFPLNKKIFCAWQMGIPAGYYFSGASAVETLPPASNLKMLWWGDEPIGDDLLDVVSRSRNGTDNWFVGGNHSDQESNQYTGGQVDWDSPMSFSLYRSPGSNSYMDNGTSIARQSFSTGTEIYTRTTAPLFSKRTKLTFTVQSSATYTATIAGIPCTYNSGGSATATEIAVGLGAAIDASAWAGTTIVYGGNVEIVPPSGSVPTVTVTANINITNSKDGYQYLSTVWQGNNNQVNCLHVYPYLYAAVGDNAGNYIMLANSAVFDATMTKTIVVAHSQWAEGSYCIATATASQRAGMTHAHLFKDGVQVAVKTI